MSLTDHTPAAQAAAPQTVLSFDERERILCQFMREPINHDREMAIAIESAALSKLRAPVAVPNGWKLVPIEPTPEMEDAGINVPFGQDDSPPPATVYAAMIGAAPDAPVDSAPVVREAQPSDTAISNTIRALLDQARYTRHAEDGEMGVRVQDVMIARAVLARYGHTPLPMPDAAPQASALDTEYTRGRADGFDAGHSAALEKAAAALEDHRRAGREWVPGSLWDTLSREAAARIRALKQPQADKDGGQQRAGGKCEHARAYRAQSRGGYACPDCGEFVNDYEIHRRRRATLSATQPEQGERDA